jgi:hypothetical protein
MIVPQGFSWGLVWFINGFVAGAEDCVDWEAAVRRAAEVRLLLLTEGAQVRR